MAVIILILTKGDKWLIGILLLLSFIGIGINMSIALHTPTQVAEIWVEGKLIKTLPLKAGYREEVLVGDSSHYNIIEADNGQVHIREANCPDQICVRSGWIQFAPQQIVCLPFQVVVKLVSSEAEVDDIAR